MKRAWIAIVVMVVALAGLIGWRVLKPSDEPVYRGRTLSEWVIHRRVPTASGIIPATALAELTAARQKGEEAIRECGTNAIPTLLRLLCARDSTLKTKLMDLAQKQHIINLRFTRAEDWNDAAVEAFWILGTNAQGAVPALIKIIDQNISFHSRSCAISALAEIGPAANKAVPTLLRWAKNADTRLRPYAIILLRRIDPEAAAKTVIKDASPYPPGAVRTDARASPITTYGISVAHTQQLLTVSALTNTLRDIDFAVRDLAVRTLRELGPEAKPAVPALIEALRDSDNIVRVSATNALRAIDPAAAAKAGVRSPK